MIQHVTKRYVARLNINDAAYSGIQHASLAYFYRDLLGFEVSADSGGGDDASWVLRRGEIDLMLNDQYEPGHVPDGPPEERVEWHSDTCLYLRCEDIDGMCEYLKGKALDVSPPKIAPYGMKQLFVSDPDNYGLCFQWPADKAK